MSSSSSTNSARTVFEDFLLAEYANLAQAFFSAGTTITQFFQHYLLALGIPLTAFGVAAKVSDGVLAFATLRQTDAGQYLGTLFLVVAATGLCVALYIINLRLDALLYARAVNGLRGYFYDRESLREDGRKKLNSLPAGGKLPKYFETWFFLPVVLAMAMLNSAYLLLGLLLATSGRFGMIWAGVYVVIHVAAYYLLTLDREHRYLREAPAVPSSEPGPSPLDPQADGPPIPAA